MKICKICHKIENEVGFYKASGNRDGLQTWCKECDSKRVKKNYLKNIDKRKAYAKVYMKNNKEIYQKASQKYRVNNPEKVFESLKNWRKLNKKHIREYNRQRLTGENSWRNNIKLAKRKAMLLNATPRYANKKRIAEIYEISKRLTEFLGIHMQVDHIVPLINKKVCGLHVENNLRIVDKYINGRKSNHFSSEVNIP